MNEEKEDQRYSIIPELINIFSKNHNNDEDTLLYDFTVLTQEEQMMFCDGYNFLYDIVLSTETGKHPQRHSHEYYYAMFIDDNDMCNMLSDKWKEKLTTLVLSAARKQIDEQKEKQKVEEEQGIEKTSNTDELRKKTPSENKFFSQEY